MRLEIQDAQGAPLPKFALQDHGPLVGDAIDQAASWKKNRNLAALAGRAIRLRCVLQEADIFAIQFRDERK